MDKLIGKLVNTMNEKRLSVKDVADALGVDTSSIYNWRRGLYKPYPNMRKKIENYIDSLTQNDPTKTWEYTKIGYCPICGKKLFGCRFGVTKDEKSIVFLKGECDTCKLPFTCGEEPAAKEEAVPEDLIGIAIGYARLLLRRSERMAAAADDGTKAYWLGSSDAYNDVFGFCKDLKEGKDGKDNTSR